jgi:hypothetical protein
MKIYIAGPMRGGYPNFNFDSFDEAYVRLCARGHIPINPTDLDRLYEGWETYPPEDLVITDELKRRVMRRDLDAIFECDAIYLLNGWRGSKGAKVEFALAEYLGLEIMYESEFDEDSGAKVDNTFGENE